MVVGRVVGSGSCWQRYRWLLVLLLLLLLAVVMAIVLVIASLHGLSATQCLLLKQTTIDGRNPAPLDVIFVFGPCVPLLISRSVRLTGHIVEKPLSSRWCIIFSTNRLDGRNPAPLDVMFALDPCAPCRLSCPLADGFSCQKSCTSCVFTIDIEKGARG